MTRDTKSPGPETEKALDRELAALPPALRWRSWMQRVEAVLFASATPVPREALARVVGQGVALDLLIGDLAAELEDRAFELVAVAGGWMLRTRPAYAQAIRSAADLGDDTGGGVTLEEFDAAVLAAVAYHQPITRDALAEIFGRPVSRDRIGRLQAQGLVGPGPRAPRRGAPHTYVTTAQFLAVFDLDSLEDLPEPGGT